jgi:hypothetical protein
MKQHDLPVYGASHVAHEALAQTDLADSMAIACVQNSMSLAIANDIVMTLNYMNRQVSVNDVSIRGHFEVA